MMTVMMSVLTEACGGTLTECNVISSIERMLKWKSDRRRLTEVSDMSQDLVFCRKKKFTYKNSVNGQICS